MTPGGGVDEDGPCGCEHVGHGGQRECVVHRVAGAVRGDDPGASQDAEVLRQV